MQQTQVVRNDSQLEDIDKSAIVQEAFGSFILLHEVNYDYRRQKSRILKIRKSIRQLVDKRLQEISDKQNKK